MTQSNFGTIDPATKSGTALATDLNNWRDAMHSMHSGSTRPSYVVAGMQWLDTAGAKWLVKVYDGADDIVIGIIDPTSNTFKVPRTRQETIKTAAYTIVAVDDQYFTIVVNSATAVTISLPTLASTKFEIQSIRNIGAGLVTIDPNGSETIEGVSSLTLEQGAAAFVWPNSALNDWRADVTRSDGYYLKGVDTADPTKKLIADLSAIATATTRTLKVPDGDVALSKWELIGDYTLSAVSALDITNLAPFDKIRISSFLSLSAASNVNFRFSTNNGVSFDTSASYAWQLNYAKAGVITASNATQTAFPISALGADAGNDIGFNVILHNFNKNDEMVFYSDHFSVQGSTYLGQIGGRHVGVTARNALRFLVTTGTITGKILIEGIRG